MSFVFCFFYRVPKSELPLAHPGESCGENVSISGEDGSHWPDALMWSQTFLPIGQGDGAELLVWDCGISVLDVFIGIFYSLTATTSLLRGSQTRRRRSLQVVQNKLPFRFQLML